MTDLATPLAAYLGRHLQRECGAIPHTVKSCAAEFRMLAGFLAGRRNIRPCKLTVNHLDADDVFAFLDHLEAGRGNGASVRKVRLPAVKGFAGKLEFWHPEHLDVAARLRAIPAKNADQPPVDHPARDEAEAILNAPGFFAAQWVSELVAYPLDGLDRPGLRKVRVTGKCRRGRCPRAPLFGEDQRNPPGRLVGRVCESADCGNPFADRPCR